jgi:two-component system sensor histidine kinase TctE
MRLLSWQLLSFLLLSVLTCLGIGCLATQLSRQIYDELLLNSADSVLGRIEDDKTIIDVDLPESARAILRHKDKDNFYYQVVNAHGKVLDYDSAIGFPKARADFNRPSFYETVVDGTRVRALEVRVQHPGNDNDSLYIEVAETFNTRNEFAMTIMSALLTAQFLFTTISAIVIYITIGKGLQPLQDLQFGLAQRRPDDLKPLSVVDAPSEVLSLVQIINRLLEQLNEHVQSQVRFAANVAHQLRTPLSGVKTYVGLALRSSSEPKVQDILERIDFGTSRLISLIERMLLLARSDPSVLASKVDSIVDLNEIVHQTVSELSSYANEKQIKVHFSSSQAPVEVFGDPISLHELTKNLIENAISYSPKGESIETRIETEGRVTLCVEDNGPGIPQEERERVFEPFFRSPSVCTEGNGLGLSIARDIAKAHGAAITIEDGSKGRGIKVIVRFSRAMPNGASHQNVGCATGTIMHEHCKQAH